MLIGISGKKRSGKSTVAAILNYYMPKAKVYAFAAPLKMEVARACGVTLEELEENKTHFRLILQGWGTDYRRQMHGNDYWIRKMQEALQNLHTDCVIIPDVRFKNEFDFIKRNHGIVIRVEKADLPEDSHVSETELDGQQFDITIHNNGTLLELANQVESIIKKIK